MAVSSFPPPLPPAHVIHITDTCLQSKGRNHHRLLNNRRRRFFYSCKILSRTLWSRSKKAIEIAYVLFIYLFFFGGRGVLLSVVRCMYSWLAGGIERWDILSHEVVLTPNNVKASGACDLCELSSSCTRQLKSLPVHAGGGAWRACVPWVFRLHSSLTTDCPLAFRGEQKNPTTRPPRKRLVTCFLGIFAISWGNILAFPH